LTTVPATSSAEAVADRAWRFAAISWIGGIAVFVALLYGGESLPTGDWELLFYLVPITSFMLNTTAIIYGKAAKLGREDDDPPLTRADRAIALGCVGYFGSVGLFYVLMMVSP
jgi:hypothetical protein